VRGPEGEIASEPSSPSRSVVARRRRRNPDTRKETGSGTTAESGRRGSGCWAVISCTEQADRERRPVWSGAAVGGATSGRGAATGKGAVAGGGAVAAGGATKALSGWGRGGASRAALRRRCHRGSRRWPGGGAGWGVRGGGGGREWELGTGKRMREMTQTLETLLYIVVFGPTCQRICGFAGSDIKISNPLADILCF